MSHSWKRIELVCRRKGDDDRASYVIVAHRDDNICWYCGISIPSNEKIDEASDESLRQYLDAKLNYAKRRMAYYLDLWTNVKPQTDEEFSASIERERVAEPPDERIDRILRELWADGGIDRIDQSLNVVMKGAMV